MNPLRPMDQHERGALAFIRAYQAERGGVSPSVREIMAAIGSKSSSECQRVLRDLEARGKIRVTPYRWRAIEVVRPSRRLPFMGRID